jgi:hypothetical protein
MTTPNAKTVRLAIIEAEQRIDAAKAARIRTAADRKLDEHIAATRANTARLIAERRSSAAKRRAMQAKRRVDAANDGDMPTRYRDGEHPDELHKRVTAAGVNRLLVLFAGESSRHFPVRGNGESASRDAVEKRQAFALWLLGKCQPPESGHIDEADLHTVRALLAAVEAQDEMSRADAAAITVDEHNARIARERARRSGGR